MPVYGKGRTGKKGVPLIDVRMVKVRPVQGTQILKTYRRYYSNRQNKEPAICSVCNSSLKQVESKLGFSLTRHLRSLVKGGKKPSVVDWDCGKATALLRLAKKVPGANYFGFSSVFFNSWKKVKNAKIIHAPGQDFFRYFKDGSIDLLFSYSSLSLMFPRMPEYGLEPVPYTKRLLKKLRVNGVLISDFTTEQAGSLEEYFKDKKDFLVERPAGPAKFFVLKITRLK